MRERLGELRHREDAGVEGINQGTQDFPHGTERVADVDVGTPDPFPFPVFAQLEKVRGLGIMYDHDIRILEHRSETLEVSGVHVLIHLPVLA